MGFGFVLVFDVVVGCSRVGAEAVGAVDVGACLECEETGDDEEDDVYEGGFEDPDGAIEEAGRGGYDD